jgi:methylated-DNA-[protein]-cysteine S-methyltransferase
MTRSGSAEFDTTLGRCRIGWSERGIARVRLPETQEARATRRFATETEEADPPEGVAAVIRDIVAHLGGQPQDFSAVALDSSGIDEFARRVYSATRAIPAGRTATYGEIAERIGAPGEARAVGQALGANPIPIIVPCHRVVAAGRRMGGFSAPGGTLTKTRLLALEGVGLPFEWPGTD